MVVSPGLGLIALAQSAATFPGVSAPSSVVRSMQRMARSSAQSLEDFLIERLPSAAARSSAPTWSTVRTPRIRDPRCARDTAVAMGWIIRRGVGDQRSAGARYSPLASRRLETVLAVHRPASRRHEGHLRQLPAVAADDVVHDASRPARPVLLPPSVA